MLDGVSKAAPGLSFMGFSAEGPGASGKLLVFSTAAGAAAEVCVLLFWASFALHTTIIGCERFLSAGTLEP